MHYDRRQSPALPLSTGRFFFLHTSNDRQTGVAVRGLQCAGLGRLPVPSGRLVVADPFSGLRRRGNIGIQVPPGTYRVVQTLADVSDKQSGHPIRVAYLSLVLDESAVRCRQRWQDARMRVGAPADLPAACLRPLLVNPARDVINPQWYDHDYGSDLEPGSEPYHVEVRSGALCLVDARSIAVCMPDDTGEPKTGWYDRFFEHGHSGSWFDRMDSIDHYRPGAANFPLPGGQDCDRIVITQTGWGDGHYPVFGEYATGNAYQSNPFTGQQAHLRHLRSGDDIDTSATISGEHDGSDTLPPHLVALHMDFRVIPFDPMSPHPWS